MIIEPISSDAAEILCNQIITDLPEYFGLPEVNQQYILGVRSRINFAVKVDKHYIGLLSLEFPYPQNSNIYWMGILRKVHGQGLGKALLNTACDYAKKQGARFMTVETLSPIESDDNYLKTYKFYESQNFIPLFDLKPKDYEWTMVYMIKCLR